MPILETRHDEWPDEAACAASAAALASRQALRDAFVELHGPLGAGKTTFARHLLRALGVTGRVKSPTYAVMEPYALPDLHIWHFDFYRFNDPQEFEDAGFRDVFASPGLKLAEWPEKAEGLLPEPDLEIHIEPVALAAELAPFATSAIGATSATLGASPLQDPVEDGPQTEPGAPAEPRRARLVARTARGLALLR